MGTSKREIKHLGRGKDITQKCKCGAEFMVHSTEYLDEFTCQHLYWCNDCWWVYQAKPRQLQPFELKQKQKDIQEWRERTGG